MRLKNGLPLLCTLALSVISAIAQAALPVSYKVVELNSDSSVSSYASGINDLGQVAGSLGWTTGDMPWDRASIGFVYTDKLTRITPISGHTLNSAAAINNAGVVVGGATNPSPRGTSSIGFIHNGTSTTFGNPNHFGTDPSDINNVGQIVGSFYGPGTFPSKPHGFLFENGTMTDLGTLGGTYSHAMQINDNGQIVGRSYLAGDTATRGFIYENGAMTALGTLGGTDSWAEDINNLGHVVGNSEIAGDKNSHAFLYVDGVMTDLGTVGWLAHTTNSYALSINDRGDVLGYADSNWGRKYFLYSDGEVLDLNAALGLTSDWSISYVSGLNENGQLAVTAWRGNSGSQALRLDPVSVVPEPATYAMLGAGLLLVGLRGRRKAAQGEQAVA